ncbi:Co-chaperone [Polyrhizophydium stewartii]|uniref:Co-chaperone n=1 Tax=Polyrhizophydium stewartii TaxID=2732419 RepID=A0ABR4N287_9FUNG|nr:hypothetical protein HK105_000844 [Polyrhizophydium stewartii]
MTQMASTNATNWKNVNNWHWVGKNCLPWAKEYFNVLKGVSAADGDTTVTVSEVSSVTGDVDLNQRKGKIITIYDLALTLAWTGTDGAGNKLSGQAVIPEFMHDTDLDDLTVTITAEDETNETHAIKEVARKKLPAAIRKHFGSFTKDLLEAHSKDVYIAPEDMTGHPVLQSYNPKPPVAASALSAGAKSAGQMLGSLAKITQRVEFVASPEDIYITLLDAQRASAWTRSKAEIVKEVGAPFRFFDGNVSGTITKLVENKRIEMKWRLRSWPEGHYSDVVIELEKGDGETILKLTQEGVPVGQKDTTEGNWKSYYWNAIKATFGFGSLL